MVVTYDRCHRRFPRFASLTPAPPPFSGMNSTPASPATHSPLDRPGGVVQTPRSGRLFSNLGNGMTQR
jgi:hypothetical protein